MTARSHRLRLGRHDQSGQIYLLTSNCHHRQPRLATTAAARTVMDSLHWLDQQDKLRLISVVVMPDHVHFVASLIQPSLRQLMHSFKSYTAQQINHLQGLESPLWQSGYHDHALRAEEDLQAVVDYCLHNPVRAGLVEDFRLYPHSWSRYPSWERLPAASP